MEFSFLEFNLIKWCSFVGQMKISSFNSFIFLLCIAVFILCFVAFYVI